jgi:hypothetical protein
MTSMIDQNTENEIFRYEAGSAKIDELWPALVAGWQDIIGDAVQRDKAAKALGAPAAEVSKLAAPPVELKADRAGVVGGEIVIGIALWVGSEVVLGALRDLAKEELKKRMKQLWSDVLESALRDHLKDRRHGLGSKINSKKEMDCRW